MIAGDDAGDDAAQAAVDVVLFGGDDGAGLLRGGDDSVFIGGGQGVQVDNPRVNALAGQAVGGVQGRSQQGTAANNADVAAGPHDFGLALVKLIAVAMHDGSSSAGEANVLGAAGNGGGADNLLGLRRIGGNGDAERWQGAHQGQVFDAVSGHSILAGQDAGVGADELDVERRLGNQDAQLVVGAAGSEDAEGADERYLAGGGQAGGDADDVLLGGAEVKEAVGILVAPEVNESRNVEVAAQHHDVGMLLRHGEEGAAVSFAGCDRLPGGGHQASSLRAASYSSAVGARP